MRRGGERSLAGEGKSTGGEGSSRERKKRIPDRLVRILFNNKSVEIYALRDYPCRTATAITKNTTCIFFVQPHKSQKNTRTRTYARWILRIVHPFNFVRYLRERRFVAISRANRFIPMIFFLKKIQRISSATSRQRQYSRHRYATGSVFFYRQANKDKEYYSIVKKFNVYFL